MAFLVALIGITASAYAYLSTGGGAAQPTSESLEAALGLFAPLVGLALPSMVAALVLRLLVRWSLSMGNALFYRELMKSVPAAAELVPDGGEETSRPE